MNWKRLRKRALIATSACIGIMALAGAYKLTRAVRGEMLREPLIAAVNRGDAKAVREMLDQGVDPNTRDSKVPQRALWSIVVSLFKHQNLPDEGEPALVEAAWNSNLDICRLLIEHGADVNLKTSRGATPLTAACFAKNLPLARLFLEHGADSTLSTWRGIDALNASMTNPEMLELILSKGEFTPDMLKKRFVFNQACSSASVDIMELLVKAGAAPDGERFGRSGLSVAIGSRNTPVIAYLIKKGALDPPFSKREYIFLMFASIKSGSSEMAETLLKKGYPVKAETSPELYSDIRMRSFNPVGVYRMTALNYSCAIGQGIRPIPAIVKILLKAGSDPAHKNSNGYAPLRQIAEMYRRPYPPNVQVVEEILIDAIRKRQLVK